MSLRWKPKDKDENLSYSVDWSRFLGSATISNVVWFIKDVTGVEVPVTIGSTVDTLSVTGEDFTGTVASIRLSGGQNRRTYTLICRVTFGSDSLIADRTIKLPIRER